MYDRNHQLRRGFTLTELIAVLAIIALLLGILLPTVSLLRQRGKIAVCASNLRQIFFAIQSYRMANKDALPLDADMPAPFSTVPQGSKYAVPLYTYLSSDLPKDSSVYHCPADIDQIYEPCRQASPEGLGISYLYEDFPKASWAGKMQLLMWDYLGDDKHGLIHPFVHPRCGANTLFLDGSVEFAYLKGAK